VVLQSFVATEPDTDGDSQGASVRTALLFLAIHVCTWGAAEGNAVPPRHPSPAHHAPSIVDNTVHMDWNNIDMLVTNHGSFAYDLARGSPGFIYPKGSGRTALFAAGPWIGAKVNGQVRVALGEFAQDFVPGPMVNGTFQTDSPRFKNYKIVSNDTTSFDYLNWPADQGAPVDSTGAPALLGEAMIWSVYNDADPAMHTSVAGSTQPLGIEVQQTTFALGHSGPIANIIFVRYKLVNKGGNTLDSMFVSAWTDPDLGGSQDDLVGCDTTRSLGYVYNSTNNDDVYFTRPPAVGFQFLQGPVIPTGTPGVYDTLGMTSFNKYIGGTDPQSALETYSYMKGLNRDGSPVINPLTSQATKFPVSGDPVAQTGWLDSYPADRRFMLSTGPFTMAPGDSQEIITAILVGQGSDRLSSITDLRRAAALARQVYEAGFPPGVPIPNVPPTVRFDVPRPNPARGTLYFTYTLPSSGRVRLALYDASGKLAALIDDSVHDAGPNVTPWTPREGLPSGVYFAVLESGRERLVKKLVVAR